MHRARQEDDAFLEQARIDVVGTFAAIRGLHHHRYEHVRVNVDRVSVSHAPLGGSTCRSNRAVVNSRCLRHRPLSLTLLRSPSSPSPSPLLTFNIPKERRLGKESV